MILYINGNYPHHSLHCELVSKIADLGNEVTVFVPIHDDELNGKYNCSHPKTRIIYCNCIRASDKLLFLHKINRLVNTVEEKVDLSKVDCILAGTIYSDGFVAYKLSKQYGIPFSVAVRETDVTYQMKWRPYLNKTVKHLLEKATNIIFLSPAYKVYLDSFGCFREKYITIPNAVNDFWFQNRSKYRTIHHPVSLIYVGEISKRKNVTTTISAIAELKTKGIDTVFHIVGSGDEEEKCRALARQLGIERQIAFHGWQNSKDKIKEIYDCADVFVMPSHRETFGTVYVEALSQGLPLIYTKGQGIDGYFEDGIIGYGCKSTDVHDIANKIEKIINDYDLISRRCFEQSNIFTWDDTARKYTDVIFNMRGKDGNKINC